VWFNGWRIVFAVLLAEGRTVRLDEGLPLQRVKCATCKVSWTIRPQFQHPRLTFQLDVAEAAALLYLARPDATYRAVAKEYRCAHATLWRWVARVAAAAAPAEVIAQTARIAPDTPAPSFVPHRVPEAHLKARSEERYAVLLLALQLLVALTLWSRAQLFPPDDPSPLRLWCGRRLPPRAPRRASRRPPFSPAMEHDDSDPPE
jgi:transposase-like protein